MLVSVVTPTFNEVENVSDLVASIRELMSDLKLDYEHIIIDNCSTDGTSAILRKIAAKDKNVKVILNARNFGQIRSPYHATLASKGTVCINLPSDGEVPVEIIPDLLAKWREGYKVVHAVKVYEKFSILMCVKLIYQYILKRLAEVDVIVNFSGYGLVDGSVINTFRQLNTVYPFYRGLVGEFLSEYAIVKYQHKQRSYGKSSNNYWSLFEYAVIGFTTYTKLPFKFSLFASVVSYLIAIGLLAVKSIYALFTNDMGLTWNDVFMSLMLFMSGSVFFVLALLSEYIYQIFLNTRKTPLVVESERINF